MAAEGRAGRSGPAAVALALWVVACAAPSEQAVCDWDALGVPEPPTAEEVDRKAETAPGSLTPPPRPEDAYLDAARALVAHGQAEQALDVLEAGLERHPADAALLALRGELLAERGFRRAAERDFLQALETEPARADLWRALGEVRLALDLPASAHLAFRRCAALAPGDPDTEALLARAAWDSGQIEKAWILYSRLLADPGACSARHLVDAATLYTDSKLQERHPEALARVYDWLNRALAREPDARAHFVRGVLLEGEGKTENAVAAYRAALALDPEYPNAGTRLALLLVEMGELDEARPVAGRALRVGWPRARPVGEKRRARCFLAASLSARRRAASPPARPARR